MTIGRLHHDEWADWEPCENCRTLVAPMREIGKGLAPVTLHEQTGTVNGRPTVGEHTPRRCSAIRAGEPALPYVNWEAAG